MSEEVCDLTISGREVAPPRPLYTVPLDSASWDPGGLLFRLAQEGFVTGEEPHAVGASIAAMPWADVPVMADHLARSFRRDKEMLYLFKGSGWTMLVEAEEDSRGTVLVTANARPLAQATLDEYLARLPEPRPPPPDQVKINFISGAKIGYQSAGRKLAAPDWTDIRANYPHQVAGSFDALVKTTPTPSMPRLVLLHGASGTGKTTAVRSLLRAWAAWCRPACVVDPERFFADMGYFNSVILDVGRHRRHGLPQWSLLVIEDADELLGGDAKQRTGQGLARLLNLTDGLIGQGLRVLVLITTNERLDRIHPAVSRAGRCLANIEFGRMNRAEATAWLGSKGASVPADGLTLAELLEARGDFTQVLTPRPPLPGGAYL